MPPTRGRGKYAHNHQSSTRNNLRNKQNIQHDEETFAMARKNLDRQHDIIDKDSELLASSPNHLKHVTNGSPEMHTRDRNDSESGGLLASTNDCKRKRVTKLSSRVAMGLQVDEAANPTPRESIADAETGNTPGVDLTHSTGNGSVTAEATSKTKGKASRGKYKSYVVDMKIKGKGSKLTTEIPDDIDRAIGDNARHLMNECGRVVRTRAPLNVKNWQEAFTKVGDSMWKEIQDKFQIVESNRHLKLFAFVMDTMQRLYRLWKARLHYYYKSLKCGKTDEERLKNPPRDLPQDQWNFCVKRFGSPEFKAISERNSKNRLYVNRCTRTTGNLSFAEVEDTLEKLKTVVAASGESMT